MDLKTSGYRLHNISPLFLFIEAIKKSVFPLLFGVVGTRGDLQDWIIIAIAVMASVVSMVQFWFYHYWLEEDCLVVKEGVLFKSLRQIPYERIQNLNIEKNILHKLFNVSTLQVESASGVKPEAVIRVISDEQVQYIQQVIKKKTSQGVTEIPSAAAQPSQPTAESNKPLYEMSNQDVVKFGFISHRALVPIGIAGSLLSQNDTYRDRFFSFIEKFVGNLHVEQWAMAEWVAYGVGFVVMLIFSIWLSSIILAFLQLYQFKLTKLDKNIHAEMGLLTKITANIPIKRIQLLKIQYSPLHRYFRKVSVKMETAGGVTEQSGITMKWIAPLVSKSVAQNLITVLQPEVNWAAISWLPVEQRAWKRVFKKITLLILMVMVPLIYFYHAMGLLMLLFMPLAFLYAKAYVHQAAYAVNDEIVAFRHGVFFHHIGIVKIGKIQNITYLQTPFDRRNHMARIAVDTAGANIATQNLNIHYVNTDKVNGLMQHLSTQVSQSKFVW